MNARKDKEIWAVEARSRSNSNMTPEEISEIVLSCISRAWLRKLAKRYISEYVEDVRRQEALKIEKSNQVFAGKENGVPVVTINYGNANKTAEAKRDWGKGYPRIEDYFAHLIDNPMGIYPMEPHYILSNRKEREYFKRWAGDKFQGWYEKSREITSVIGDEDSIDFFEGDWHEEGPEAYYRGIHMERVRELICATSERVKLETTKELLQTIFKLGDGTKVTWGDATVPQHKARIAMLSKNAGGVIETASRHVAAIKQIQEAGVSCLRDLEDLSK